MKDLYSIGKNLNQDRKQELISLDKEGYLVSEQYWLDQFKGDIPVLDLPLFKNRHLIHTYNANCVTYSFADDFLEKIKVFSQKQQTNLFTILMAGVNLLLHKYTKQEDIVTGTIITGKDDFDLQSDLLYVNMLAIRTQIDKESRFADFLQIQKKILANAFEHQQYPFNELKNQLNIKKDNYYSGLFDVLVVLKSEESEINTKNSYDKWQEHDFKDHVSDITFSFVETENLDLKIEYNSDLYEFEIINRMFGHFEKIMTSVMADNNILIKNIEYVTELEKLDLLSFNSIIKHQNPNHIILDLFKEQVENNPDGVAVVSDGISLTYSDLDQKSNQLAHYLISQGIEKNPNILLCFNTVMDKSIIGILGIMKSGGVYIPVDSDIPEDRISYIISDTKANFVISNRFDSVVFSDKNIEIIGLDSHHEDWNLMSKTAPAVVVNPTDLAYIIYTSGTTGNPKGVMISHENLSDYFIGLNDKIDIEKNKVNCLMSTLATDLGNTVLYSSLIYGNTLHLFSKEKLRDSLYLHEYFAENQIDCIKIVATYWKSLEYDDMVLLPNIMIIFGGEELSNVIIEKIKKVKPEIRIINHYGPTETTIGKLLHEVKDNSIGKNVPIGKPFSDTKIYVVDENLNLSPKGIWGELLIGGKGVFKGYLNQPSLTQEKRIINPFQEEQGHLYKTGDRVRVNLNGEIEFGSRLDNQVKIQGYRVELSEIEAIISHQDYVKECTVTIVDNANSDKILAVYLVVKEGYNEQKFKESLKKSLPMHMIPSIIVELDSIPITSNGKVDRKKLPDVNLQKITSVFVGPENDSQKKVIAILEEIFNKKPISIDDNFFELGGDSIKSIQVVSRLSQSGYLLTLGEIIKNPVIRDFSEKLKIKKIVQSKEDMFSGDIPLSPIQKLFFEKKKGDYNHYNQSIILTGEKIEEESIRKALDELIQYHDTLRIKFKKTDQQWTQYYGSAENVYQFSSAFYDNDNDFIEKSKSYSKQLNIENGPLIQICLLKKENHDKLLFIVHHLLVDGVSFRILAEDLSNLYNKFLHDTHFVISQKGSSLKEWQTKLIDYSNKFSLIGESVYWDNINNKTFDRLQINSSNEKNTIAERSKCLITLDENKTQDLITKCYKKHQTEINEILITALALTLNESFGINRILLALEGHGRENIGYDLDIARTIGWFTSIFPVYIDLEGKNNLDVTNTLLDIKNNLNSIPNKGIGYGILKYLKKEDFNTEPEITFNYLGDFASSISNNLNNDLFKEIEFVYQDASEKSQCNDILNFTGIIKNGKLEIYISFNKFHFTIQQIEKLAQSYKKHLIHIITELI
ncbi:hypothetical protein ASF10_22120 [Flavobacterium sp. Leaf82]|uniref:non-ribosomal peptide synthetase n=1 Tax=unclassified Flavobacterium TaxID=196869 RepID=UPI0006FDE754|nr:non-ribosomal peptide synthetase [Flavobacterium sp. Leaf82]KQO31336.1 hypothetical protein ASF10_22120 [Flavobacterium sp. Leaf82]